KQCGKGERNGLHGNLHCCRPALRNVSSWMKLAPKGSRKFLIDIGAGVVARQSPLPEKNSTPMDAPSRSLLGLTFGRKERMKGGSLTGPADMNSSSVHHRFSSAMALPFFTVGHSTRTIPEFTNLLRVAAVQLVVDIRSVPRSRRNPQYNREELP